MSESWDDPRRQFDHHRRSRSKDTRLDRIIGFVILALFIASFLWAAFGWGPDLFQVECLERFRPWECFADHPVW